eukprot:COSAG06_NODE_3741_length_4955_cov_47.397309_6_plen_221_part_00
MLNNVGFTFGSDWDNVSVAMDQTTLTATRQATSLILATQPHEISILQKVRSRGGVILYNGAPVTTSWARAFKPADAMYFAEDGEQCRVRFLHLSTPIALTRYSGGDSDIDPKYNATCAGTSDVSTCLAANIIANLDYGVLPFLCAHRPRSLASPARSFSLALTHSFGVFGSRRRAVQERDGCERARAHVPDRGPADRAGHRVGHQSHRHLQVRCAAATMC